MCIQEGELHHSAGLQDLNKGSSLEHSGHSIIVSRVYKQADKRKTHRQTLFQTLDQSNPMQNFQSCLQHHSLGSQEWHDWWSRRDRSAISIRQCHKESDVCVTYILASESVMGITRNGGSDAVHTFGSVVESWPLCSVHSTSLQFCVPMGKLLHHHLLHDITRVVCG